jgi:hypothetical protein
MKEENIKVMQYMFVVLLLNVPVMYMLTGYIATTYMIISSIIGYICVNGEELRRFFLHYSQKYNESRGGHNKGNSMDENINTNEKEGNGYSTK